MSGNIVFWNWDCVRKFRVCSQQTRVDRNRKVNPTQSREAHKIHTHTEFTVSFCLSAVTFDISIMAIYFKSWLSNQCLFSDSGVYISSQISNTMRNAFVTYKFRVYAIWSQFHSIFISFQYLFFFLPLIINRLQIHHG